MQLCGKYEKIIDSAELRIFFAIFVQNDDTMIIGRTAEIDKLRRAYESEYSQFVTVYGRRRVGKTFLVRETFNYTFTFEHAGLANSPMKTQLKAWQSSLKSAGKKVSLPKTWIEAFDQLKELIKEDESTKKVIFIQKRRCSKEEFLAFCLQKRVAGCIIL